MVLAEKRDHALIIEKANLGLFVKLPVDISRRHIGHKEQLFIAFSHFREGVVRSF